MYSSGVPPLCPNAHHGRRRRNNNNRNESRGSVPPAQVLEPWTSIPEVLEAVTNEVASGRASDAGGLLANKPFSREIWCVGDPRGVTSVGAWMQLPDTAIGIIHPGGVLISYITEGVGVVHHPRTDSVSNLIEAAGELLVRWNHMHAEHSDYAPRPAKGFYVRAYQGQQSKDTGSHSLIERMFAERDLQTYEFMYDSSSNSNCIFVTWKYRESPIMITSMGWCLTAEDGVGQFDEEDEVHLG